MSDPLAALCFTMTAPHFGHHFSVNKHCTKPPSAVVLIEVLAADKIAPQHKQRFL